MAETPIKHWYETGITRIKNRFRGIPASIVLLQPLLRRCVFGRKHKCFSSEDEMNIKEADIIALFISVLPLYNCW
jgi:hypothetical protein